MQERNLATVRKIAAVKSIEGADRICAYQVDGWFVVDTVGKYQVDQVVIYIEPDAWVPHDIAPFLSRDKEPRVFEGVKGERLRTVKLKGQISQGLLLSVTELNGETVVIRQDNAVRVVAVGDDVSEFLGIQKWEAPIPAQLAGLIKGNFPTNIPKTAAERIQNIRNWSELSQLHSFEVTEKLHGSSCTFYLDENSEFHVCSRNLDLKEDENNAYWKVAKKFDIENKMKSNALTNIAIQGEMIGEGINGNQYKTSLDFYAFSIYDCDMKHYVSSALRKSLLNDLGIKSVPSVTVNLNPDVQDMLKQADGASVLNGSKREGFVLKSQTDTSIIIKVISNKWLISGGEDQ